MAAELLQLDSVRGVWYSRPGALSSRPRPAFGAASGGLRRLAQQPGAVVPGLLSLVGCSPAAAELQQLAQVAAELQQLAQVAAELQQLAQVGSSARLSPGFLRPAPTRTIRTRLKRRDAMTRPGG
jgi:hypothetical protein